MKTTVISVLGTQKDAHGGSGPSRWDTWRPTIGLVQQESLPINELHLIFNKEFTNLAERVKATIRVSQNYKSYSGLTDGMDGEVKFIYKTEVY